MTEETQIETKQDKEIINGNVSTELSNEVLDITPLPEQYVEEEGKDQENYQKI